MRLDPRPERPAESRAPPPRNNAQTTPWRRRPTACRTNGTRLILDEVELPDAIDQTRGFVVQVTYTITGLSHSRLRQLDAHGAVWSIPVGTGFVVSDEGWIITAKHLVDFLPTIQTRVPEGHHIVGAGFAHKSRRPGTFRVIKFDVVATDARNDIALLKLRTNPFTLGEEERLSSSGDALLLDVAQLRPARPRDGTAIAISGYPLMESVLVTTAGSVASAWSVDYQNALVPDGQGGYKPADIADRYLADVQANPGNSGGPAYQLADGTVVGMLVATRLTPVEGLPGVSTSADLGILIPVDVIARFASHHGVPLTIVT
jgi:S1-C subfamily serine protease